MYTLGSFGVCEYLYNRICACVCWYVGVVFSVPVSRFVVCVCFSGGLVQQGVWCWHKSRLESVCVSVCEKRELCPCEQACSLNLLGSIPARCLNVDRVALKAGKWIFCPELFPSGFSFSLSNSLNHLLLFHLLALYSLY